MIAKKMHTWVIASCKDKSVKEFRKNLKQACKALKSDVRALKNEGKLLLIVFVGSNNLWMRDELMDILDNGMLKTLDDLSDIMFNYVGGTMHCDAPFVMTLVLSPGIIELSLFCGIIASNLTVLVRFMCDGYSSNEMVFKLFSSMLDNKPLELSNRTRPMSRRGSYEIFSEN